MEYYNCQLSLQKSIADSTSPCQLRELMNKNEIAFRDSKEMYDIFFKRVDELLSNEFTDHMITAYKDICDDLEYKCSHYYQVATQNQTASRTKLDHIKELAFQGQMIKKEDVIIIKNKYIQICTDNLPKNVNLIDDVKKEIYKIVLDACNFNQTKASRIIGCSVRTLSNYIKENKLYEKEKD